MAGTKSNQTDALVIQIVAKDKNNLPTPENGTIQVSGLKFWHEDEPVKPTTKINNVTGTWDGVTGASASNDVLTLPANITGTGKWDSSDTVTATWTAESGTLNLPADTNQVKMTLTYDTTQITGEEKLNVLVSVGGEETNGQQIDSTGNGTVSFVQSLKGSLSSQSTLTVKIHAESGTAYSGNFTISNISFATVEQSNPAGTPVAPVWDFDSGLEGWHIANWSWNYQWEDAMIDRVGGMLKFKVNLDPSLSQNSGGNLVLQWNGTDSVYADLANKDYVTMTAIYNADAITGAKPTIGIAGATDDVLTGAVAVALDPDHAENISAPAGEAGGSWKKTDCHHWL